MGLVIMPILGRLEMIPIHKALGTGGHLRNGAIGEQGEGKVSQEEGTAGTIAQRLRTAWCAQMYL